MRIYPAWLTGWILLSACGSHPVTCLTVHEIIKQSQNLSGKQVTVEGFCDYTPAFESFPYIWETEEESRQKDLAPRIELISYKQGTTHLDEFAKPFRGIIRATGRYEKSQIGVMTYNTLIDMTNVTIISKQQVKGEVNGVGPRNATTRLK